jgi:hypothetical protein
MASPLTHSFATGTQHAATRMLTNSPESQLAAAATGKDSIHLQGGKNQANEKKSFLQRFFEFFRTLGRTIKNLFKGKPQITAEEMEKIAKQQSKVWEKHYKEHFLKLESLSAEEKAALRAQCFTSLCIGQNPDLILSALQKAYQEAPDKALYTEQIKQFLTDLEQELPGLLPASPIPQEHHKAITQQFSGFKNMVEKILEEEEEIGEFKSNIQTWHQEGHAEFTNLDKMLEDPERSGRAFSAALEELPEDQQKTYKVKVESLFEDQLKQPELDADKKAKLTKLQDNVVTNFTIDSNIEQNNPNGAELLPFMITVNRKNAMLNSIRGKWNQLNYQLNCIDTSTMTSAEKKAFEAHVENEQNAFKNQIQLLINASEEHLTKLTAEGKAPNSTDVACFNRLKGDIQTIYNPPGWTSFFLPMAAQYGLPKEVMGTYGSNFVSHGFNGYFNNRPVSQVGRQIGVDVLSLKLASDILPNTWWNPMVGSYLAYQVNSRLDQSSAVEYYENWVTGKVKGVMPTFLTEFWNTLRS